MDYDKDSANYDLAIRLETGLHTYDALARHLLFGDEFGADIGIPGLYETVRVGGLDG